MTPEELSQYLRLGEGSYLVWRRGIVVASFVAALCMQIVALYQMGILSHVPEPPLPGLNADAVDAAPEAYSPLGLPIPDALLGLVSYSVTAALAGLRGDDRVSHWPWLVIVLALKILVDAAMAGWLSYEQWSKHRAFCSWCLLAALATFASVGLVVPETVAAIRRLLAG